MKFDLAKDKLLILLIAADVSFIVLHLFHTYTILLPDNLFSIGQDRGYGEFFQYTKELWVAILLFLLGLRKRKFLYIIFAFLFLYFLIDDALEVHERFGAFLSDFLNFQPNLGLRAIDFGELAVSIFFGALFFIAIGITHHQSDSSARTVSKYLIILIVLLALFGVVMDMLEIIVEHAVVNPILVTIEEGGEMLVMSMITWFVFRLDLATEEITIFGGNV
ncbi:MAG TPA: hypothetical protein VIK64_00110 [Anaerolineales bacterium]|jgi:hypothetical protein